MEALFFIVISVVIAAGIGGMTNYLAIKMLFHPREAKYIGGRRLYFTPGLIPKRKDEIARSLGKVVGDYLVTTQGLSGVLRTPALKEKLNKTLVDLVERWSLSEETLEQLASRIWPEEQLAGMKKSLTEQTGDLVQKGFRWLWEKTNIKSRTLGSFMSNPEQQRADIAARVTDYFTAAVIYELNSENGDRLLRRMIPQFLERAGGLLGTIAGIFMDEERMIPKLRAILVDQLESPTVKRMLREFLERRIEHLEQMKVEEAVGVLLGGGGIELLEVKIKTFALSVPWVDKISGMRMKEFITGRRDWIEEKIPRISAQALHLIEANLERIVSAIELPKLVEDQVKHFPIERLEHIILSVSGREFRAITWLGAFLGGMIGLAQAVFLLWYM
jgi:uncharacterized membrane protein YheB (UPF0754 family)